jgi:hypothetical protein
MNHELLFTESAVSYESSANTFFFTSDTAVD